MAEAADLMCIFVACWCICRKINCGNVKNRVDGFASKTSGHKNRYEPTRHELFGYWFVINLRYFISFNCKLMHGVVQHKCEIEYNLMNLIV
jgi:hypothetical protein